MEAGMKKMFILGVGIFFISKGGFSQEHIHLSETDQPQSLQATLSKALYLFRRQNQGYEKFFEVSMETNAGLRTITIILKDDHHKIVCVTQEKESQAKKITYTADLFFDETIRQWTAEPKNVAAILFIVLNEYRKSHPQSIIQVRGEREGELPQSLLVNSSQGNLMFEREGFQYHLRFLQKTRISRESWMPPIEESALREGEISPWTETIQKLNEKVRSKEGLKASLPIVFMQKELQELGDQFGREFVSRIRVHHHGNFPAYPQGKGIYVENFQVLAQSKGWSPELIQFVLRRQDSFFDEVFKGITQKEVEDITCRHSFISRISASLQSRLSSMARR